jgi:putative membrane protein
MKTKSFDWSQPQRQPMAALVIIVLKTAWDVVKRLWPLILIILFRSRQADESGGMNKYEIIAIIFAIATLIGGIFNYIFFRFYIQENDLVIKKGWLKKETILIPLQKIQAVQLEQPPLHQVLEVIKLKIDTAGSSKTEVTIEALSIQMAKELQLQLKTPETIDSNDLRTTEERAQAELIPVHQLKLKDLLRLSLSSNHIETFFILLSFSFAIYENLRRVNMELTSDAEGIVQATTSTALYLFIAIVLVLVFIISTLRVFLNFYDFSVFQSKDGFRIKSGLLNVKERLVKHRKTQYISWKANWIRKLMDLWIFKFHIAGGEGGSKMNVQVPFSNNQTLSLLTDVYHPVPTQPVDKTITIHPSYVVRRILIQGLLPASVLVFIFWFIWYEQAFWIYLYPVLVGIHSWLYQRKFKAWSIDESLFLRRGILGEEFVLINWYKLQTVVLQQSIYQRKKGLATVVINSASGALKLPYIPLKKAQQLTNYAIYKVEKENKAWL